MKGLQIKTPAEIEIMCQGGEKLARVKAALLEQIKEGKNAAEIEFLAEQTIRDLGATASFKMVPGYHWAICVNVNSGLVHGIPTKEVVFKKGDLISVDLGVYFDGFHTDSSLSVGIKAGPEVKSFLAVGQEALKKAIEQCYPGKRVYDLSEAIQTTIEAVGYTPIRALVGHGVGRNLHEDPAIPCFVPGPKEESQQLEEGLVLAIEVMYCQGKPEVVLAKDGWTISMADGKIAALYEETVAVTKKGPLVLTSVFG